MDSLQWEDTACQTGFSCTFGRSSAILGCVRGGENSDTPAERDETIKTQQFIIGQIPAVLYGEHAERSICNSLAIKAFVQFTMTALPNLFSKMRCNLAQTINQEDDVAAQSVAII